MTDCRVHDLINPRQGKSVSQVGIIQIGIIYAHSPLVVLFWNNNQLESYFGYWISLMKLTYSSLSTSYFITSCLVGWNHLNLCRTGLQLSHTLSWCSTNSGKTLGISACDRAKTSANSRRRDNMEATSSLASEVPKLTCSGLSGSNRECICNGSAILVSPCAAD